MSRSIKEIDNVLDGSISLMIGDFEFAMGSMGGVWLVVKAAVSKWTAQALVEEQKQKSDLEAFAGQPIGVSCSVTFEQAVAFKFAQVVSKLVQSIGLFRKMEALENDLMNVLGAPAPEIVAGM